MPPVNTGFESSLLLLTGGGGGGVIAGSCISAALWEDAVSKTYI